MAQPEQSAREHLRLFPTPDILNMRVVEVRDSQLNRTLYPAELDSTHPNTGLFPNHKLTFQGPVENKPGWIKQVYATLDVGQNDYNFAIKYSGESVAHPIYIRSYLYRRDTYTAEAKGTPDPVFGVATLIEEEMRECPDEEIKNIYVAVIRVYETIPGPLLTGQTYDGTIGLALPFTEQRVAAGYGLGNTGTEITPISVAVSKNRVEDLFAAQAVLASLHFQFPTQERIQLPDKLISATAYFSRSLGDGQGIGWGNSWSYKTGCSASVSGDLSVEIEQGFNGVVPATVHIFFLPADSVTSQSISARLNAQPWPVVRTKSHTVVLAGASVSKEWSAAMSLDGGSKSDSADGRASTTIAHIPPTIHGSISIGINHAQINIPRSGLDVITDEWKVQLQDMINALNIDPNSLYGQYLNAEINFIQDLDALTGSVEPAVLNGTNPSRFPAGDFIVTSDVALYDHGMVKVTAVVVNTSDYV